MPVKFMLFVLVICLLGPVACKSGGVRKQVQDLDYAIKDYAYALRWSRHTDALAYHMNRDGSRPKIDLAGMEAIRVTGFAITEQNLNEDISEAAVRGELNYYHNDYGTLRTINYSQSWWYEPESGKWYIESGFPRFD